MTKREALLNRICVVLLLVGAVALTVFALRGKPERPPVDTTAAVREAHLAFVTIRDWSYEPPDTGAMLDAAWISGLKAAGIPGKPRRSMLDAHEEALAADIEFLLTRARSGPTLAIVDSYIWGLADGADDPHTRYLPLFGDSLITGLVQEDGLVTTTENEQYLRVIGIAPDSIADRAGLQVNDLIRAVPGPYSGPYRTPSFEVVLEVLRGPEKARLKKRHRVTMRVEFGQGQLVNVTESDDRIAVVRAFTFQGPTPSFERQLYEFGEMEDGNRVVVDLRGNRGGSASNLSIFMFALGYEGQLVRWENRLEQIGSTDVTRTELPRFVITTPKRPERVVVLVDSGTGSAAEIAAWALRDRFNATIIGSKTAGVVRGAHTKRVSSGTLSVATHRTLLGPDEVDIEGVGITPDIIIEQDNAGLAAGRDNVLERAIQLLKED